METEDLEPQNIAISIKDLSVKLYANSNEEVNLNLSEKSETFILRNVNISLQKSKLIGIIGPVGSGKSSLLKVILRELPLESGSVRVNGTVSYANQEPWTFEGTIRQNILFGQEMDRERYIETIKSCSLNDDFHHLKNGDRTIINEGIVSLSGGQRSGIK